MQFCSLKDNYATTCNYFSYHYDRHLKLYILSTFHVVCMPNNNVRDEIEEI